MTLATTEIDDCHLRLALDVAARGRGRVSPNPVVGAVIVKRGEVIGQGWHTAYGKAHAEVEALRSCVADPGGATLYVTLEPCCHHGQTPPCTEAILAAGLSRVVVASDDPTPKASGRGLGILRDEGIDVSVARGAVAAEARRLNQPFRKVARAGRPYVAFKSAMSLDGKVATRTGDSKWISGEPARQRVHRLRADADAVACGIGTVLADDPLLTARAEGVHRQPARIVFDSQARLPATSRLHATMDEAPLIVVIGRAADGTRVAALEQSGAEIVLAAGQNEAGRIVSALDQLASRGIGSILLEGGPHLAGAFMDAGEIDRLHVFIAPVVLGGRSARTPLEGTGRARVDDGVSALRVEREAVGEDEMITATLREW